MIGLSSLFPKGRPRIGWLIDGDPDTPDISVMLENDDGRMVLTIPIKGFSPFGDPYGRWFLSDVQLSDDPDQSRFSYSPPETLSFRDAHGTVTLTGCRTRNMASGAFAGRGELVADFGVIGARHLKYEKINGLRSTIPAMWSWSEIDSVVDEYTHDPDGRLNGASFTVVRKPTVRVHRRLNLSLYPTWSTDPGTDGRTWTIEQGVDIRTQSLRPRPWFEHVDLHESMRELVAIACWERVGYSAIHVHRGDDPERALSGTIRGPRWSPVVTSRLLHHEPFLKSPRFLFRLTDLPPGGLARWVELRAQYRRTLGPVVALLDRPSAQIESDLADSGAALEALGYQIAKEHGGLTSRQQVRYRDAISRVIADMPFHPVADPAAWASAFNRAYRSVKHPDNPLPDGLEALNVHRQNLLMIRYWVAARLGVAPSTLERRLPSDPLGAMYQ